MLNETKPRSRVYLANLTGLVFAALGFDNAVIAAGVTSYLNSGDYIDPRILRDWSDSKIVTWLWPTSIMMMVADSGPGWMNYVVLVISVIANACLFGVAGLVIGTLFQKVVRPEEPVKNSMTK